MTKEPENTSTPQKKPLKDEKDKTPKKEKISFSEKSPKKPPKTDFEKTTYSVKLGSTGLKYVRYNNFKGTTLCDIREMYNDKNTNELKPGFKGISLKKDLVEKIFNQKMLEKIDGNIECLNQHNELSPIDIEGSKIKIQCSKFKGKFELVGIREFYEDKKDGGKMKPGKKGISLSVDQWRGLVKEKDNLFALFE